MNPVSTVLISAGVFFFISGTFGILRLPDFYTRTHATTKCDTMGSFLIILGFMVESGFNLTSLKLFVVVIFVYLTSPVISHMLAREAFKEGFEPWRRK